jgi:hypothetical protein
MQAPNTALLPTAFCPPISYIAAFLHFERVQIEQHEHYQKGGMRNRCFIATANGPLRLTVPLLKGKHQQLPVREVRIDYRTPWIKNHWHAIESAYRRAPFFEEYSAYLLPIFQQKPAFLFDLNLSVLTLVLKFLRIPGAPALSEAYEDIPALKTDLRQVFRPNEAQLAWFHTQSYPQVFEDRQGFIPNLSILDLLFCLGPEARFKITACIGD